MKLELINGENIDFVLSSFEFKINDICKSSKVGGRNE